MQMQHVSIFAKDLEKMKDFFMTYFPGRLQPKYSSPRRPFESYTILYDAGPNLDLMWEPDLPETLDPPGGISSGYSHLAFSVGSREAVDALGARLRQDGYEIVDGPRTTGQGEYVCNVLDPEGNKVEFTI
ncbi:MAG: glyoxalase [Chloroflexi bacterium]|jgi:lactoylglutathione lyase|nr:VOC family protein [Anaerolineaceae bacterium]NMB90206.1 glyoxalase [Chloroflexota bacterium]